LALRCCLQIQLKYVSTTSFADMSRSMLMSETLPIA
jgi:hypothetical protein